VPQDLHQPLRQRAIVLNKQPPAAHALLAFLAGAEAQRIFVEHGFEPAPAR
jgi:ABC-type molybdate transport system substrate-binding protein